MDNVHHTIVHTGQHYDDNMSSIFFTELEIPLPDFNLDVGSGGHGVQTGRMLEHLEVWFLQHKPDVVLVYGDTNSTLAACLAATKIHIPVAHIEAGLRSFNRSMPEEINRVATDHASDRLYAPTPAGIQNLTVENLASRAIWSGDVMRDAVEHSISLAESRLSVEAPFNYQGNDDEDYGVLTLHRPVNTEVDALVPLMQTLDKLSQQHLPLVFPVHPRTRSVIDSAGLKLSSNMHLTEPLPYLSMLQTVKNASVVLTDSGGLQKEAAFLGTHCITLRAETEWTETVDIGVNFLAGTDETLISRSLSAVADSEYKINRDTELKMDDVFGSGDAASVIAKDIVQFFA